MTTKRTLDQIRNEMIAIFKEHGMGETRCEEEYWERVEKLEDEGHIDGDKLRVLGNEYDAVQ